MSNTNNYDDIEYTKFTLKDIDDSEPIRVGNTYTVRNVFNGLNKIIKAIKQSLQSIVHRKCGEETNVIPEDMRGKTFTKSDNYTATSNYVVTINELPDDYRSIICKLSYNDQNIICYWHPFLTAPTYYTTLQKITCASYSYSSYDYFTASIKIDSIKYEHGKFTVIIQTTVGRVYRHYGQPLTITMPTDGVTFAWEVV